jgi:hypothetical protein
MIHSQSKKQNPITQKHKNMQNNYKYPHKLCNNKIIKKKVGTIHYKKCAPFHQNDVPIIRNEIKSAFLIGHLN